MPPNAPDNFIVLATRNIDPLSLRLRLTTDDMDKQIAFLPETKHRILKREAVLFRKDGSSFVVSRASRFSQTTSYRFIYKNQPFDLTTNLVGGLSVKYLTPEGEVAPAGE